MHHPVANLKEALEILQSVDLAPSLRVKFQLVPLIQKARDGNRVDERLSS
jgi:hypothetical protein